MVDFHVAIGQLYAVARGEVIGCPGLTTDAGAADPTAQDCPIVRVSGTISAIGINKSGTLGEYVGVRGLQSFNSQLHIWKSWNLREVETRIQRRPGGPDGRNLIDHKRVGIYGQPVPQPWNTIAEVESRKAFARIVREIRF